MTNVSVQADSEEKELIEAVSYDMLDCSQSAGLKHVAKEFYSRVAGDIHPRAIRDGAVDVSALMAGEIEPEDVDEKYRTGGDGPAQVPQADGGAVQPAAAPSYTPTYSPQDLATSGVALSWDELKDAVDQHWSDELQIHPDRVKPEVLKNNQKVTAKILAAVIRHEADAVSDTLIEQKIEDYLGGQVRRADYESGLRYKINQYEPLIREHFASHPNEDDGRQYTTESARKDGIPHLVSLTERSLNDNIAAVDFDTWRKSNVEGGDATVGDVVNWIEDLAEFRSDLETLSAIVTERPFQQALQASDLEHSEEYEDPMHYVSSVLKKRLKSYESADPFARYVAVKEILELEDDDLRDEDLDSKAVVKFETGDQTPKSGQLATVTKRVV